MMAAHYALLDGADLVIGLYQAAAPVDAGNAVRIPTALPWLLGQRWTGATDAEGWPLFEPVVDTRPTLTVALAATAAPANAPVDWTAEVRLPDGSLAPVAGTYYVPITRRADGWQERLLTVTFAGGQAAGQIAIGQPGVYTLRLDDVEPAPVSKLAQNPKLIVTEA
jgi:hypothetical protein